MSIKNFVKCMIEGRDAPLYHWVNDTKLINIFGENRMAAKWEHKLPWHSNQFVYGNSMSRNEKLNWAGGDIRLTFDQRRLNMTNKIVPLDGERIFHQAFGWDEYTPDRDKPKTGGNASSVLSEEFVIGDIKPLNKYITEIQYSGDNNMIKGLIRVYAHKYGIKVVS